MTTTDSSFVAEGPAHIGFYAKGLPSGLEFGALTLGSQAGACGATDDAVGFLPPAARFWANAGILGVSNNYYGVYGYAPGNPLPGTGIMTGGVYGESDAGFGVRGWSDAGYGVYAGSGTGYGVYSWSEDSSGMYGQAGYDPGPLIPNSPNIAGVIGSSDQRPGVIGTSNANHGVYGFSHTFAGVVGETDSPTGYAGVFNGNVAVNGLFSAAQVTANVKAAVVPFPDGSKRVLYCMESPDHWFEDFGTGKLKRERAVVKIDRDFAKVIKRGDYHIFLTPRGECHGLYVRSQGGASFEVRELGSGTSSVAFSYCIVGRRKDVKGHRRFAKIDMRLPPQISRPRRARSAPRAKMPPPTPEGLRALAAHMQKAARAQMRKHGRKGKRS
jgi:hypothetical protein